MGTANGLTILVAMGLVAVGVSRFAQNKLPELSGMVLMVAGAFILMVMA